MQTVKRALSDEMFRAALKKIKMVGFDFDGTLTQYVGASYPSSWNLIDTELGCRKEKKAIISEFYAGKFDIATFAKKSIKVYKKYGLTKQWLRDIFLTKMRMTKKTDKLFELLHSRGVKTAIISGSIKSVYDLFVEKFGVRADYVKIAHEFTFDKKGKLKGGKFTLFDYEFKIKPLEEFCSRAGISVKECAYVGDELNDLHIFKEVGLPIAVNATKQEVREAASRVIDRPDFSPLLRYLR